jgi:hypothetical protein
MKLINFYTEAMPLNMAALATLAASTEDKSVAAFANAFRNTFYEDSTVHDYAEAHMYGPKNEEGEAFCLDQPTLSLCDGIDPYELIDRAHDCLLDTPDAKYVVLCRWYNGIATLLTFEV